MPMYFWKLGFVHNDLHSQNIHYDSDRDTFTFFDFDKLSRVYSKAELRSGIENDMGSFLSVCPG